MSLDFFGVIKAGYVLKEARKSKRNVKRRYLVLTSTTLTYYEDQGQMKTAKGDVLLTSDTNVEVFSQENDHVISITSSFDVPLNIIVDDEKSMSDWAEVIRGAINNIGSCLRGYLLKRASLLSGGHIKYFFILHNAYITYHKDHETTQVVLGRINLGTNFTMSANEESFELDLVEKGLTAQQNVELSLQFDNSGGDFNEWKERISDAQRKLGISRHVSSDISSKQVLIAGKFKFLAGEIFTGDQWEESAVSIVEHYSPDSEQPQVYLHIQNVGEPAKKSEYSITNMSTIYETSLAQDSFEITCWGKVVHLQASSQEELGRWIADVRSIIGQIPGDDKDPMLQGARELCKTDTFKAVVFKEKKLGLVLERSLNWAVIRASAAGAGASVGTVQIPPSSAVHQINDRPIASYAFEDTMKIIVEATRPLLLVFRQPPTASGYLWKASRGRGANKQANWKQRYFIIEGGVLEYREDETSAALGVISLLGATLVYEPPSEQEGRLFCFSISAGVNRIVCQAENYDAMLPWCCSILHAIGLANGGGHLKGVEALAAAADARAKQAMQQALLESGITERDLSPVPKSKSLVASLGSKVRRMSLRIVKPRRRLSSVELPPDNSTVPGSVFEPTVARVSGSAPAKAAAAAAAKAAADCAAAAATDAASILNTGSAGTKASEAVLLSPECVTAMSRLVKADGDVEPVTEQELGEVFDSFIEFAKVAKMDVAIFGSLWGLVSPPAKKDDPALVSNIFKLFDSKKTGSLTREEFQVGFIRLGKTPNYGRTVLQRLKTLVLHSESILL
jgi:hypothetical protein